MATRTRRELRWRGCVVGCNADDGSRAKGPIDASMRGLRGLGSSGKEEIRKRLAARDAEPIIRGIVGGAGRTPVSLLWRIDQGLVQLRG
jgi:hypothetical protein